MKILLLHNFYGSSAPSGENKAFLAECDLLKENGHEVIEYTKHSDEIRSQGMLGKVRGAVSTPWNPISTRQIRQVLGDEQPDIMHVHNFFPLLSPAVFFAARNFNTTTVFSLHNYRVFCAAGIPLRNNVPCTECLDRRSVWPALKYGCYRQSRLATLPLALMISLHRTADTWKKHVDVFIVLTEFQLEKMVKAGLPGNRIFIKPHFYSNPPTPVPWNRRKDYTIYIGRLGPEKGVHLLIEAWKKWGSSAPFLEIIGSGPEEMQLRIKINQFGLQKKIHLLGQLPFPDVQKKLANSKMMVMPSLCFEGFPMVIREAFALGVPVAASRIGSLTYLVDDEKNGVLFTPGDSEDLYRALKRLWESPEKLESIAGAARKKFEEKYTAEKNYEMLMAIYQKGHRTSKETSCIG